MQRRFDELDAKWDRIEARARNQKYEAKTEYRELKQDIDRRFDSIEADIDRADDRARGELAQAIDALQAKLDAAEDDLDDA